MTRHILKRPAVWAPQQGVQRPQWPFSINLDSPLAENLVSLWTFAPAGGAGPLIDMVGVNDGTFLNLLSSNWITSVATGGWGLNFDIADADAIQITGKLGEPAAFTMVVWAEIDGIDTNNTDIFSVGGDMGMRIQAGGITGFYRISGTWNSITGSIDPVGGQLVNMIYVVDPSHSNQRIYVDGVSDASGTATDATVYDQGTDTFFGRHGAGQLDRDLDGRIYHVAWYNNGLTDTQAYQMWDPATRWDLYYPLNRTVYFLPLPEPPPLAWRGKHWTVRRFTG